MLSLDYKEGKEADYAAQIQTKFKKLLESDPVLAKEFKTFEAPPPEEAQGRYSGEARVQAITLDQSEYREFRGQGGTTEFEQTIALYYRFDQGVHRGEETLSGFFARFKVTGTLSYHHVDNEDFKLANATVKAQFEGFSRNLVAPKPAGDN